MAQKIITWEEYSKHIFPKDCWVMVDGLIYDASDYLVEHPGGDDILVKYSGIDATQRFNQANHSDYAKSLRDARYVGKIENINPPPEYLSKIEAKKSQLSKKLKHKKKQRQFRDNILPSQVKLHNSEEDCWVIIHSKVYDVTQYLNQHPGGVQIIMRKAGKDATKQFEAESHSLDAIKIRDKYLIGSVQNQKPSLAIIVLIITIIAALIFWKWS